MVRQELVDTSTQLPQVATDIGNFMTNISPGVFGVGLTFVMASLIILVVFTLFKCDIIDFESREFKLFNLK